jgi:membrane associated rhomboid family serine protease
MDNRPRKVTFLANTPTEKDRRPSAAAIGAALLGACTRKTGVKSNVPVDEPLEQEHADVQEERQPPDIVIVPEPKRLWPWAAALASARIPFRIVDSDRGRAIAVPVHEGDRAHRELAEYERVNRSWPHALRRLPDVAPVSPAALLVAFVVSLGLIRFYMATGPVEGGSAAFEVGSLRLDAVRNGEWWRVVTALTLHADAAHVFGNALFCGVLGVAIAQFSGPGLAWFLILMTGIAGNALSLPLQSLHSSSIGASTSAFGALGIVAVFQSVRVWRHARRVGFVLSRAWLPVLAALGLLGFLGTGRGADLGAHVFGFGSGIALGGIAACVWRRPAGNVIQAVAGMAAASVVVIAWRAAVLSL